MKLKYIITALFATLAVAVGCEQDYSESKLDEIQLSQSTVAIPLTGGSQTITVKSTDSWSFVLTEKDKKGNDVSVIPSWLTISPTSGKAGETKLTLSADAAVAGSGPRTLKITCGTRTQYLTVIQGTRKAEPSTCAQVLAGSDGKTYRVTGVCTSISNFDYGNWYLTDKTGTVYIYGTLDKKGTQKNFTSLGIEVGDVVTVEGPKTTYRSTVELVNVTVVEIVKSLLKVVSPAATLPKEGGDLAVKVAYKGNGVFASVPEEVRSWAALASTDYIAGVPTKILPNPADTAVFHFQVAPNTGMTPRDGNVEFASAAGKQSSSVAYSFSQKGNMPDLSSIMDALKTTFAHIEGSVMALCQRGYVVSDKSGSIFVYTNKTPIPFVLGDKALVVGPISTHNFGAQIGLDIQTKLGHKDVVYPAPVMLDAAKLDEIIASKGADGKTVADAITIQYVEFSGQVVKGKYTNIRIGTSTNDVSPYYPLDSFVFTNGQTVTCTGYATSISGDTHLNVVITSMK